MRMLLICSLAVSLAAQTPPRPRVGLVLSGGSALGLSHIGVLKWLDEHHIPVDAIGGTSMGGLVAGLYATGHSADEIEKFVAGIDWSQAFAPGAPFRDLTYRRKEDKRAFPNNLELGLKGGVKLPSGLSPGQEVGLILARFAAPYAEIRSFDDLPTPFRCVATDLISGKSVIFRDGPLEFALRATMSLPGIFAPVPDGNRMLVDGGVLNNLPADVMKAELKPDVLIAVALLDEPPKKDAVSSILGVAGRTISVMVDQNERRNLALADLVLAPRLTDLKSTDFDKYEEFIARGYEAAKQKQRFLETLAVSDEQWRAYLEERKRKRRPEQITPRFVDVQGIDAAEAQHFDERLEEKLDGKPTEAPVVEDALTRITGDGRHQSATYGFETRNGVDGLMVNVQDKTNGPPFLDLGLDLEGSDTADLRFGLSGRLTYLDIGEPGAEWRSDFQVGLTNQVASEYYWRAGRKGWFLAPRGMLSRQNQDVYQGKTRVAQVLIRDAGVGGDVGYTRGRFEELRLGYEMNAVGYRESVGVALPSLSSALQTVRARYVFDNQDSPVVPTRGIYSVTEWRWNFQAPAPYVPFGTFEEKFVAAKTVGGRYVLLGLVSGGAVLGHAFEFPAFSLGGPFNLSALAQWQLRGNRYYDGGAAILRAFSTDPLSAWSHSYAAFGVEAGKAFSTSSQVLPVYDSVLGFVSRTPVGAVFLGGSLGTDGNRKVFFRVGRLF